MATLLIVKNQGEDTNFSHFPSNLPRFEISDFYIDIDNGDFQIKELNGGKRQSYSWDNVSIRDDSSGSTGPVENFSSISALVNRLIQLKYPAYWKLGSGGNTGVQTVSGNAVDNTDPQNPVINIPTSGGGLLDTQIFTWTDGPADFTISDGYTAKMVHVSGSYIRRSLWNQFEQTVTIDETLFPNDDIEILIQQT